MNEQKNSKVAIRDTIVIIAEILIICFLTVSLGGMLVSSLTHQVDILEKQDKIASLQKEIEQLAPLKFKIDQYIQITEEKKLELEELKKNQ